MNCNDVYILRNVKQQNAHLLKINVLIQFFVSSTFFEHHVSIIRKTICTCRFYGTFSFWNYHEMLYKISKYKKHKILKITVKA